MNNRFSIAILFATLAIQLHVQADPPPIISYQGKVAVGNVNFTGAGQFKFALVNGSGSTTYWSNDGTSTAGSQPTAAVSLNVASGLFTLLLGDISLANMTAIPPNVFANSDVRVRVWFNDGTHGFQLLSPDERVASNGYAFMASALNMPSTASPVSGVIMQNGNSLLHTYGVNNLFFGLTAGNFGMTGSQNTAIGSSSLSLNTGGFANTAIGHLTLSSNSSGYQNTASGTSALQFNTTGIDNTANGALALNLNSAGNGNTALGSQSLALNTTGSRNVAVGGASLNSNLSGINNTAAGHHSLLSNTTGNSNIAVGNDAGSYLTTGSNNIDIGHSGVAGESNIIRIGDGATQTDTYLTGVVHGNGSGLTGVTATSVAPGSITGTQIASGAVGSSQLSGVIGSPNTRSVGTVYQAASDGFLVGYTYRVANNSGFRIYSDSSPTPTTVAQEGYHLWVSGGGDVALPITFPVKKGNYYYVKGLNVFRNEDNSGIQLLQFIPFGQ